MAPRKKKKEGPPPLFGPMEAIHFETFRKPDAWAVGHLQSSEPSCFNGDLRIRKYRVHIELVEESKETYTERLQKLWEEDGNWHHHDAFKRAAKELGFEFVGPFGAKAKKNG